MVCFIQLCAYVGSNSYSQLIMKQHQLKKLYSCAWSASSLTFEAAYECYLATRMSRLLTFEGVPGVILKSLFFFALAWKAL